jgi:hypothetical protein
MFTKPFKGKVKIGKFSGLRKLMRAARRGMVPPERLFVIEQAEKKAALHPKDYMHSVARGWANWHSIAVGR